MFNNYNLTDEEVLEIIEKYENLITILLSQFYGKEARNQKWPDACL